MKINMDEEMIPRSERLYKGPEYGKGHKIIVFFHFVYTDFSKG